MGKEVTRAEDNRVLTWVRMRTEGKTSSAIAAIYGVKEEWVRVVTNRVRKADVAHCGPSVSAQYWSSVSGPKK
jgi:hypothetical protein